MHPTQIPVCPVRFVPDALYGNSSLYDNSISRPLHPTSSPAPDVEHYLGDLISGTYCSRLYSDCLRRPCRLQSPNFPGIYPRNITCYYAVRQDDIPAGKAALITVSQPLAQLTAVRSQAIPTQQPQQGLKVCFTKLLSPAIVSRGEKK